ncbi:(R)-stereoselective amidase [Planctomycetes bacterium Poly30]|uniref:(R)-stereoselective amidase n=1 Tax=Saltatorellus ferox TaxID=2528018 RepID=A0A518F1F1_9BACT|nr:(R)-stereoselective amidase [Planctomycetes bacterium Poly30]
MQMLIAVVQFDVAPSDPDTNLRRMEAFIEKAARSGADLAVFPEDAVTGPLEGQGSFLTRSGEFLAHFQQLALKYGIDIVPGTWTVVDGASVYNTAYYVQRDGTVAGFYSKVHLWETEAAFLTPGPTAAVFPTIHGRVGLTICWDIAFPETFAQMRRLGVELVISPTYWSFTRKAEQRRSVKVSEVDLIDSLCRTRAFENDIVFVYCNAAGELETPEGEDDVTLSGRSQVTHPQAGVLVLAEGNAEQMLLARIDHTQAAPPLAS